MKKATRNKLIVFVIAVLMLGSTIGFVISYVVPQQQTQQSEDAEFYKTLITNKTLSSDIESKALKAGFTIVEFKYRDDCNCDDFLTFLKSLPSQMDMQTIIILLNQTSLDSSYKLRYYSTRSNATQTNLDQHELLRNFCKVLWSPQAECAFVNQTV